VAVNSSKKNLYRLYAKTYKVDKLMSEDQDFLVKYFGITVQYLAGFSFIQKLMT
jgi:hypothetical protein